MRSQLDIRDVRSPQHAIFRHSRVRFFFGFWFLVFGFNSSQAATTHPTGPLPPTQARASLELEPGLDADLIAAEPLVQSPCALCWDERGRTFVAENIGYPNGGPHGEPVGGIALLEDTDGDGIPDKRTVFADKLSFPNGVMPWRGGLIVTCAPDVLYLKDTKGDGHADVREVLLTGFSTKGSTQLRVNSPTLGPDGWVYLAGGLAGGVVYSPKHPGLKLDTAHEDLKFRPDPENGSEIELVRGKGQFGLTFDDVGNRFVCMNRVQVQHAPLQAIQVLPGTGIAPPGSLENCPDLILNTLLTHSANSGSRVYPISGNVTTADSHAGTYTAACGVHVARGDALPPEYVGLAWSCEPTANLARCDKLVPNGGTFHAVRVHADTEAFRSRDDWCRPVFLADGPDGALYVCDMYRRVIEHPDYLPEEMRKHTDFTEGKEMGRIWRVRRSDVSPAQLAERSRDHRAPLEKAETSGEQPDRIVAALASPDGWTRDTASRLIVENYGAAAEPQLGRLFAAPGTPVATRVACLRLISAGSMLLDHYLLAALADPTPAIRQVAAELSAYHGSQPVLSKLLTLAGDPDVHVRYAVTVALEDDGGTPEVADALATIARRDADDRWARNAILCSATTIDADWRILESLAASSRQSSGSRQLLADLAHACNLGPHAASPRDNLTRLLSVGRPAPYATRAALLCGFGRLGADELRHRLEEDASPELKSIFDEGRRAATDATRPVADRADAVTLIGLSVAPSDEATLATLVSADQPVDVAVAAVRAIAVPIHAKRVPDLLRPESWRRYPPTLRATVLSNLIGRPELAPPLLDAIESGAVSAGALNPAQKDWLQKLKDGAQRARAEKLFAGGGVATDRQKTYEETKVAVMALKGVATHGQKVFRDNCTTCHRLDREGVAVGPDLLDVRSLSKETMLLHIVIPELEIAPNFTCYNCTTTEGRTVTGILIADDPAGVTLRQPLAVDETIPREKIRTLEASKLSLMPQGLEKAIAPQDMADLLAYLRGEK